MAVSDVVDLVRAAMRDDGNEILRETGEDGLNVVEYMERIIQARLTQRDLHLTLWEQFAADPDNNYAEVVGALEALAEGDRDLATHLNQLLEEYNSLAVASGTAWQPAEKEAGQTIVDGLRDDLMTMQSETLTGVTNVGDAVDGLPDREDIAEGNGPRADRDDANPAFDRLAKEDALLDMEAEGVVDVTAGGTIPEAGPNAGGEVEEAARAALGQEDKELEQFTGKDRSDLIPVSLDDVDLDDSAVDAGREESMLSDFTRAGLPGGVTGKVAVQEGEDIGGDTYLADRFIPNEDQADDYRPGYLYDSNPDDPISYEQSLRPGVITVGDIDDALEPVLSGLRGGQFGGVDRAAFEEHLELVRAELLRGNQADVRRLQEALGWLRGQHRDAWDMLWWEIADLAEDLPPAVQAVVKEVGSAR